MTTILQRAIHRLQVSPWTLFALLFFVSFALTGFHALFPVTSAWDEHSHLSYVQYAFNWKIPREGDPLNAWAMAAFSCHPHEFYGYMTAVPCGELGTPGEYPAGLNTAAGWPPLYYFAVALLIRIPLLFISDPLIAARLVTAVLWSVGVAWISVQLFQKSKSLALTFAFAFLSVSISAVTAFASFVSPHALNPLLIATGLFVTDRMIVSVRATLANGSLHWRSFLANKWIGLFAFYGVICALSIPQSMSIVFIFGMYSIVRMWQEPSESKTLKPRIWISAVLAAATTIPVLVVTYLWQTIQRLRTATEVFASIKADGASSDAHALTFQTLYGTFFSRFWEFWPLSLHVEWPSGEFASFIENFWLFILVSLSISAVLFWKRTSWLSALMLSLLVISPLMSTFFTLLFPFAVPKRYALGVVMIGVIALGASSLPRRISKYIFWLALTTYLLAFFLDPLKVDVTRCAGSGSEILCRLLS